MQKKISSKKGVLKPIEIYKHKDKKRKNNPHVGAVTTKTDSTKIKTKKYEYDPHLSPELQWAGKSEGNSFEVPSVSLHVHEKIDPRSIIETVRSRNSIDYEQMSLFHDPEHQVNSNKDAEFYKHEKLWANRMIAGDSLLVMNSLLEKEDMAGKVQCIYIDPPYGIKYGSNFQPFTNKRDVKDKKDDHLTAEPETLKAFRDTWELGIHSYLTYMRDRLLLSKELLTESGSCFVQISDKNVHLVRNLMDEVFGVENFISLISYTTTSGFPSTTISREGDYLIWYTKNIKRIKYRDLYLTKGDNLSHSAYLYIELQDGTHRPATKSELSGHIHLPENSKICSYGDAQAKGPSNKDTPFEFAGKIYRPNSNSHWKANYPEGMALLKKHKRLMPVGNTLRYIRYFNDFPMKKITNLWRSQLSEQNKSYVVQTATKVIQRCLLMTTDPGDIVLDPTCGSGTTAFVAEHWGRRWITCDTSRVAIALAKQRLMTATFDYYELKNNKEGINSGFNYKTVPHITLGSIANDEPPAEETLYDQPIKDSKKTRVTGPFTVEAVPAHKVDSLSDSSLNNENHTLKESWFEEIKANGIRGKKGFSKDIEFTRLEHIGGSQYLYAEGETKEDKPKRVIICFGSEYAPLEQRQIEEALKEAEPFKPDLVIFCAFQFDPEAGKDVDHLSLEWTSVLKVQMNSDLLTSDLKKKTKGDSFWLIGQPDIQVTQKNNKYIVTVNGFDYYNTTTNTIDKGGKDKIAMWMLDTNYDEKSVYPRQVFFPISSPKHDWTKLKKTLGAEIDEDLINKFTGTESIPFELGEYKKIAVKIIDDRGIESLVVKTLA